MRPYFSLDAMNAAIRRELDRLNDAPMASGESRRALFEANERATLTALPADPWEWPDHLSSGTRCLPPRTASKGLVAATLRRRRLPMLGALQ